MKITMVGAGNMGAGYGALWTAAGHSVTYTYARTEEKLRAVAGDDAGYAVDPAQAAVDADVVVLSVPWGQLDAALAALGPLPGRVVVDALTPLTPAMDDLAVGHTTSGAEIVAERLPGARVVMALQNTFAEILRAPDRTVGGRTPTMLFCGDDPGAKTLVAGLIRDAGFVPVDAGPLRVARFVEPACVLTVALAHGQGLGSRIALSVLTDG